LQTRDWEGEDGVKRYRTEVVVENMIMLDSKGRETGESYGGAMDREPQGISAADEMGGGQAQKAPVGGGGADEVSLDDLPF
jgi:single-strand DNA-binding protein